MAELPILRVSAPHVERRIHKALAEDRLESADRHRGKLALSGIGGCVRNLWAGVREIPEENPMEGRVLVLFEHGNATETHLLKLLRRAGYIVVDKDRDTGQQYRVVDHDGLASGRLDGFICDSKPGDPWRLLELKSANESQFETLLKVGYEAWQPKYADQLQVYMGYAREQHPGFAHVSEALVVVECKNDSRIHSERIRFDKERFYVLRQKAALVLAPGKLPPERPAEATSQYCAFCKWCARSNWCWSSTADVRFAS